MRKITEKREFEISKLENVWDVGGNIQIEVRSFTSS